MFLKTLNQTLKKNHQKIKKLLTIKTNKEMNRRQKVYIEFTMHAYPNKLRSRNHSSRSKRRIEI